MWQAGGETSYAPGEDREAVPGRGGGRACARVRWDEQEVTYRATQVQRKKPQKLWREEVNDAEDSLSDCWLRKIPTKDR